MKHYLTTDDIDSVPEIIAEAIALKKDPYRFEELGKRKTLGMLFFNSSLRTRLSTQKAAMQLGMQVMVMNFSGEAWSLEFEDGSVMNGSTSEHIKEAAAVISQYCDVIAVRAFPTLTDKEKDEEEYVLKSFQKYASVPVVNMESATAHPLQALTDAITITELKTKEKPKVVLSWAPHPKALPHAVANSFTGMMRKMDVEFVITHPVGYELNPEVTGDTPIIYDQDEALKDADFVYVKNWSSYKDYGQVLHTDPGWRITPEKMALTDNGKFMHCLPVRRNVIVDDAVLDSPQSVVIPQANNRTFAAQIVLKHILQSL
ncbi:N-acetylornithine carbamoyltransferase [Sinomicrobium pectinilyticum]|uniref:N-succinylornithine carbamoyltransferase n=1 Tax=Sinomicrobium pectinilyticum TaxID=1084421 RepID=A0A3N0E338_SINP1|nr:N-acetylornithine carbamoyltransferase [Sinomicrobium pectinilyticum]RNL82264.1 N-acetylornithine carbamoyltransferase [Sinomicrobium pectinilyticum]